MLPKMNLIHEGKVKRLYQDPDSDEHVVIEFTDFVTAGDGEKKEEIKGKAQLACDTNSLLMKYLQNKGIPVHLTKQLDGPRFRARKLDIFKLEVVCRNRPTGSFCKRYGEPDFDTFSQPLVEFFLKDDNLGDPFISKTAAASLGLAKPEELGIIESLTLSVNYYLTKLLAQVDLVLVDFKLEFGRTEKGQIMLADEISGDTMRVWGQEGNSLDKDVFRQETGGIIDAYSKLLKYLKDTKPDQVAIRPEQLSVVILPKEGIKNPPGEVTKKALKRLGFGQVSDVRVGKIFEIEIDCPVTSEIVKELDLMGLKLLSNPIAEKREVRFD
jgi:phosphoribosylaminoimidazole-succinocarboxamide synthase